jgi:7,8-dihydropterin-6-yl-methyl-4-(beta-D-ribofuranosyl)aminobenzene 5'-phosphate synthase
MSKLEIFLLANNVIYPFQNLKRDFDLEFIELNKLFATKSLAEHGLGFLLNIYENTSDHPSNSKLVKQIIFDTGGPNQTFLHNLDVRGYPIYDADIIVLSHWHYDHSGALYNILERIDKKILIFCHENARHERIFIRSSELVPDELLNKERSEIAKFLNSSKVVNQLPLDEYRIQELDGELVMHDKLKTIFTMGELKMMVSGEIERTHHEEEFSNFLINKNGILKADEILDDKCLIIELESSIILINGCCHSGIMNTLDYVKKISTKPISHIIGGFHMANSNQERIRATLDYLSTFQKEKLTLFPIHCSGDKIIGSINKRNIPNLRAFNASVGTTFNFDF